MLFFFSAPPTFVQLPTIKKVYPEFELVELTVLFRSRFENTTTVTWLHDDAPLPENAMVVTAYPLNDSFSQSLSPASTSLIFSSIRLTDIGMYTLTISNSYSKIPRAKRTKQTTFNIDVLGTYVLWIIAFRAKAGDRARARARARVRGGANNYLSSGQARLRTMHGYNYHEASEALASSLF